MKNMMIKLIAIISLITSLPLHSCRPLPITQQPPPIGVMQRIRPGELIEMPTFSVKAPSGEGWGFKSDELTENIIFIKNKVIESPDQVRGKTTIQLRKIRELSEEKWQLNEDEYGNYFMKAVENDEKERQERIKASEIIGWKPSLKIVSKGVTDMDGKKMYFLKYKLHRPRRGDITEVDFYLFIPPNFRKTHIFYTFEIEENYMYEWGTRKAFQVDLDQILPVMRSFQIKNVTEE